ncbi:MAG: tetratricopeptide repeat protein, partial [Rhodothermales bacterium]|nr:tetratricopeptide repeat protein [Rhodothermales bacterium]
AYVAADRHADAIGLVEERMERAGAAPNLYAELGALHFDAGDLDAAHRAWADAIAAAPQDPSAYRQVYAQQVAKRLYPEARDALLQGRERLGDPDLFRVELAELFARTEGYAEALQEWAALVAQDEQQLHFVRSRIGRLLDQAGAAEAFADALDRLIREEPLVLAYRDLSAWLNAERGDFEAALDATRALDRLRGAEGQALFAFAESALAADAFGPARKAFDLILQNHPESPAAPLALLGSAVLHEQEGLALGEQAVDGDGLRVPAPHFDRALERYRQVLERYPNHPRYPFALHRLAQLQKDVFRDYAEAERLLNEVLTRFARGAAAAEARLDLGELALMRGDLHTARRHFTAVEENERIGEAAERARLELARLELYEGAFDTALARAQAMNRNTATDVANDAIALKLLVTEGQGPDSLNVPLRTYARAQLLLRQHRPADALAAADSVLATAPQHALADDAAFLRAEALRAARRPAEALSVLAALPQRYPESHLADRALFLAAEIQERDLGDADAAMAAYADLLARYPGSLLAPEARARIRRLRGDGV